MTALDFITAIIIVGCCIMGIFFLLPAPNACPFNPEEPQYLIRFTVYLLQTPTGWTEPEPYWKGKKDTNDRSVFPGAGLKVNATWCSGQAIGTTDENGTVDLLMYKTNQYHTALSNETYYSEFNIGYPKDTQYILFTGR
jgi:hypothetical protein